MFVTFVTSVFSNQREDGCFFLFFIFTFDHKFFFFPLMEQFISIMYPLCISLTVSIHVYLVYPAGC